MSRHDKSEFISNLQWFDTTEAALTSIDADDFNISDELKEEWAALQAMQQSLLILFENLKKRAAA